MTKPITTWAPLKCNKYGHTQHNLAHHATGFKLNTHDQAVSLIKSRVKGCDKEKAIPLIACMLKLGPSYSIWIVAILTNRVLLLRFP